MKNIFAIVLFFAISVGFAQDKPKEELKELPKTVSSDESKTEYNQIFTSVDVSAQPAFGMTSFRQYVARSFRVPEVDTTTVGRVVTKFSVCEDGSICDIQIVSESPVGLGLGDEAKRILNVYGNWKPAILNEKAVSSYYTLPIAIQIEAYDAPQPQKKHN